MAKHEVVIGVTGGIAAYKTATLVSQLVQREVGVSVVMTESAGRFIGAATFAALTARPVLRDVFDQASHPLGAHIDLANQDGANQDGANRAELLCVAPATANFLAKAATGLADDLLSTLYLSFSEKILMAPAMNSQMWEKASVQRNVATLRDDGVEFVGPEPGWLSCRRSGVGRMAAPETLLEAILQRLGR